jgi:ketosteroid isomerase-like protein
MKSTLSLAALLLVATAHADLNSQIVSRYRSWDAAYRKHDVVTLARMLAPEFQLVTGSGKRVSRSDYIKSLWKTQPPSVYRTRLQRAMGTRTEATALTEETSVKGDDEHRHRYRDRWINRNGRWLLLESRTLEEK